MQSQNHIQDTAAKIKILFIVNPFSGVGRKKAIEEHLKSTLDTSRFDYQLKYTAGPQHATELSRQALDAGFKVIVAVGGDGTVNEAGRPLVGTDAVLGIVPSGSGNGLARHLHIPMIADQAIALINNM
ncbi:MAG: diacylglycerol/lipid kinase family protein, partial [Bacteroidota bacterium]